MAMQFVIKNKFNGEVLSHLRIALAEKLPKLTEILPI